MLANDKNFDACFYFAKKKLQTHAELKLVVDEELLKAILALMQNVSPKDIYEQKEFATIFFTKAIFTDCYKEVLFEMMMLCMQKLDGYNADSVQPYLVFAGKLSEKH